MKEAILTWVIRAFDRGNDPVHSCGIYQDKKAGSCSHVDGLLCDFPKCSMLIEYKPQRECITKPSICKNSTKENTVGMIKTCKKYRFRDGVKCTLLAVGLNRQYPVVAVRHEVDDDRVISLTAYGKYPFAKGDGDINDIIEVGPWDDFKIDDWVMVSNLGDIWYKRYFAGIGEDGRPTAFADGITSWSNTAKSKHPSWDLCRYPTPEELGVDPTAKSVSGNLNDKS